MSRNPLSALSYTNKDFQTIYVELLDLVKQLTKKWDPSISNESDPGVILLKLNAIIADKNNYNIDKNILEAFPQTVTQEVNARNLYEQLAYKMPWYQSGVTTVQFRWKGNALSDGELVTIPQYTMLTDSETSVVYTTLNKAELYANQPVTSVPAAQGIVTTYSANNTNVVTLSNLDSNRRLYLGDYSVAQNQIFITNVSVPNVWKQVDNLAVEQLGSRVFEFGVDSRSSSCFIEFPEDIDQLIGEGLVVRYLVSEGASGNIAAKAIDRLYEEISVPVGNSSVALTQDVLELYNTMPSRGGADPETVSDAFKSYKKVAGTFHTLVTLRDYINFINSIGTVSNGFVCDRTNDVQSTYTIVTDSVAAPVQQCVALKPTSIGKISYTKPVNEPYIEDRQYYRFDSKSKAMVATTATDNVNSENYREFYVKYEESGEPQLSAFDLRMYVLEPYVGTDTIDSYENSFHLVPSESTICNNILGYMLEQKCVQHDFLPIVPNIPCMFRNSFPISIKIIPTKMLTTNEISSVRRNILSALRKVLNASKVSFGMSPDYDVMYNAINNSDDRIKTCIIDDFEYTTFAIYWDGTRFIEIPVSSTTLDSIIQCNDDPDAFRYDLLVDEPSNWSTSYKSFYKREDDSFISLSSLKNAPAFQKDTYYRREKLPTSPKDYKSYYVDELKKKDFFENCYFICNKQIDTDGEFCSDFSFTGPKQQSVQYFIYRWNRAKNIFKLYSDKLTDVRLDIIAKSILAGKTALYEQDTSFAVNLHQEYIDTFGADRLTTGLVIAPHSSVVDRESEQEIHIDCDGDGKAETTVRIPNDNKSSHVGTYTLKKNESVRFLGPLLETENSYTGYTKFEACLLNKEKQLVATTYDSTKHWLGTAYLSKTDYDNVCLRDWTDIYEANIINYKEDGPILGGSELLKQVKNNVAQKQDPGKNIKRALLLDNNKQNPNFPDRMNAQAALVVPTTNQKYATKYSVKFNAVVTEDNKVSTTDPAVVKVVITPYHSADGTGSMTSLTEQVITYCIPNEETKVDMPDTSIPPVVCSNEAGLYTIEYVNPQNANSFSISFRAVKDGDVVLQDVSVTQWRTDVSAPLKEIYRYYKECSTAPVIDDSIKIDGNLYTRVASSESDSDTQYIESKSVWYECLKAKPKDWETATYYKSVVVPDDNSDLNTTPTLFLNVAPVIKSEDIFFSNYPYKYYQYEGNDYVPIASYMSFGANWGYAYYTSYFSAEHEDSIDVPVFVPVQHVLRYSLQNNSQNIVNCGTFDKYFSSHEAHWKWELAEHNEQLYWKCHIDTREGTPSPHIELDMWSAGEIQFRFLRDVCEIPPNTSYKLRKGEYVTLYWREEDADDAPYKYKRLSGISEGEETVDVKSPIIQPNFLLYGSPVKKKEGSTSGINEYDYSSTVIDPTLLDDEGNILYGTDSYIRVSNFYGDNDLSGTKELRVQTLKQVTSTPRKDGNFISKYFFVTNYRNQRNLDGDGDREYCYLRFHRFDKDTSDTGKRKYRCYLGPDETFVYMNDRGTSYALFGSGTMLGVDFDLSSNRAEIEDCWSESHKIETGEDMRITDAPACYWKRVPCYTYEELVDRGVELLNEEALTVHASAETFIVGEQQLFTVVEGDTLRIRRAMESPSFSYIDDSGKKYETSGPIFTSFGSTYVTDYEVSYTTGSTTIDLPKIDITDEGDARWVGRAALNLSTSSDAPQSVSDITPMNEHILNEGIALQYIVNVINDNNSDVYPTTLKSESGNPELKLSNSKTVEVESDVVLDKVGGNNIDVSYLSWSGDKEETHFYIYQDDAVEYKSSSVSVDSKHNVNVHLDKLFVGESSDKVEVDVELPIKLQPATSYIVQIRNTSKICSINFKGDFLQKLSDGSAFSKIDGYGTYYVKLTIPESVKESTNLTITVTRPEGAKVSDTDVLIIAPFYKSLSKKHWKTFNYMYNISEMDILARIQELDYNQVFKYNNVVDKDLEIEDPLNAASFFDTNHIFQQYTVPKAECRISEATGSKIHIVNNR